MTEYDYEHGWTVVECNPNERGADAIIGAFEVFYREEDALEFLANIRDDDPEMGNGWTTVRLRIFSARYEGAVSA